MPLTPARLTSGLSSARKPTDLWGMFGWNTINPASNSYFNDFNTYVAGDWTVAPATGSSALTAGLGGNLTLTTGAVGGNGQGNALTPVSFAFTAGYQTWFSITFTCADNSNPNWVVGLTAGGASAPTSGVYFTKATAVRTVSVVLNKAGVSTTIATTTSQINALDATALSLGIYYDGKAVPSLHIFSSTGLIGSTAAPSPTAYGAPPVYGGADTGLSIGSDPNAANPLTNLPTVNLQPSFFIQTNTAAAKTMVVDYVWAACEINRF